jgi:hypothetical protein
MNAFVTLSPEEAQTRIEQTYGRHFIDQDIEEEITTNPYMIQKIEMGVIALNEWLQQPFTYDSKIERTDNIANMDIKKLVIHAYVCVAFCQLPETLVTIAGKLSNSLGWSDRVPAVTAAAEILAVLCQTDTFDIFKYDRQSSLMVVSQIPLSDKLIKYAQQSEYLPPLIIKPVELTNNFQSPYLTFNDSVILRRVNQHAECASLDVINSRNAVPLALDYDFISTVEETPKKAPETVEALSRWNVHVESSRQVYMRMLKAGNRFYMHNKCDKRGRLYVQGYHINPQGTAYKKACVDLANTEVIEGVPGVS